MKKFRELISRPFVTAALFALALVLLGGSTVGGARAALTVESELYNSQVQTYDIDVVLVENDVEVEGAKTLLTGIPKGKDLIFEKNYPEVMQVRNTGSIDEYVRVSVYRYWLDEKGNKFPEMESSWIDLGFVTGEGWTIDGDSTTEERTVLYYSPVLAPGATSSPFLQSVAIDENAARTVVQNDGDVITTTYFYNGKSFCVEVHVDGVQTHNADSAKLSAWGVNGK